MTTDITISEIIVVYHIIIEKEIFVRHLLGYHHFQCLFCTLCAPFLTSAQL